MYHRKLLQIKHFANGPPFAMVGVDRNQAVPTKPKLGGGMRVFMQTPDGRKDASLPEYIGNLVFFFGLRDILPLNCPLDPAKDKAAERADYIMYDAKGWYYGRDSLGDVCEISTPLPNLPIWNRR